MRIVKELNLKLYTLEEVASSLDVTKVFLQKEIKRGRLLSCTLSKVIYISEDSWRDYLNGKRPPQETTENEEREPKEEAGE